MEPGTLPSMQLGQIKVTPQDLAVGMLIALGILIIVRDILRAADLVSMHEQAQAYRDDPNKLAEEALDYLGQDPGVADRGYREEEEDE